MFKAQAGLLLQRLGGDVLWFIIMFAQVLWDTDRGGEEMGEKEEKDLLAFLPREFELRLSGCFYD